MNDFVQRNLAGTLVANSFLSGYAADRLRAVDDRSSVKGLALRAIALVQSLSRLNRVADVQLVIAANRAVLELLVDVILLAHYGPNEGVERLEAWELSAKYKFAFLSVKYVKEKRGELSEVEKPLAEFVAREEANVESIRQKYWPDERGKGRHPDRWTKRNLLEDIQEADRLEGCDLEGFYQTENRKMNLQLHGSTLAGYRGLDLEGLATVYALGQKKTAEFVVEAVRVAFNALGILDKSASSAFERVQCNVLLALNGMASNSNPPADR